MFRPLIFLGVCLTLFSLNALAFLEDAGARKEIKDLQQKTDTQNQQINNQIQELNGNIKSLENRLQAIELIMKNQSLMELQAQIEKLNGDLSFVKGDLEVLQHQMELALEREKSLYQDIDNRIRKLEAAHDATAKTSTNNITHPAEETLSVANSANAEANAQLANENKSYNDALALLNAGQFKQAFDSFDKFIHTYPSSKLLSEAQFNLGLSQFSLKNFKAAMATQQKLIGSYPDSPRIAEAKLMLANCQIQLSDTKAAKETLRDLISQHPDSDVIPQAKKRLAVLNALKK
jgi:tol-pal system protein YbgF